MAAIKLDIGGDTRRLDRDIQKTVNRAYTINLKTKGDAPLGRITGKVNEFNKSLDASNARVIAFGATTAVIFGVQKAFRDLVSTTIEVQKSLKDINVILNASTEQLQKFGSELFNIAKNTGQSFQTVAQAATELSRQGLGLEETLKRTNEALILSRLSGLDAAKSVEALTAAVNSYASQAVTATEVVNKFANVDASFAVSSRDLAEALGRVGSSAAQSGINLNELIAIVTAAQQATARGGAVIGNSFKTIFTRLQRGKVVDLLEGLGINTTNETGQIKSTIQLLQDLAQVYDNLGTLQQAEVAEKVGGVFQINILKAALADLSKEYSVYDRALQVAASSSDQAIKRNEELNKTFAAQINALQQNIGQLSSSAGERLLTPIFDRTVGNLNKFLGSVNDADAQGIGATLGRGILDGLGQIIAGPGLALIGGIFIKLFSDVGKFAKDSIQVLLGLNQSSQQQQDLQKSISDILSKNPELIALMEKGTAGVNKAAEILLTNLQAQTVELQKQEQLANTLSKKLLSSGVRIREGVPVAPTSGKAAGYIPNFASDKAIEKSAAISLGASPSVRPKMSKGTINGKKFVMNSQEIEFPGVGKNGDSMVIPLYGGGEKLLAAKGFIPNFNPNVNVGKFIPFAEDLGLKVGSPRSTDFKLVRKAILKKSGNRSDAEIEADIRQIAAARQGVKTTIDALKADDRFAYIYASKGPEEKTRGKVSLTKDSDPVPYSFTSLGTRNPFDFEPEINKRLTPIIEDLAKQILPKNSSLAPIGDFNEFVDKSAFSQIYGRLFETVVNRALDKSVKGESGTERFEFFSEELSGPNGLKLQKIFSSQRLGSFAAADLKFKSPANSPDSTLSFIKKIAAANGIPYDSKGGKLVAASGYIPNFSALDDAIGREQAAGIPNNQIYLAQEKALKSANPMGLGVFNKRDEPTAGKRREQMRKKGFAKGYIPNFAADTAPADLGSSIAAVTIQLASLAFFLGGFKGRLQEAQAAQIESLTNTITAQKAQLQSIKQTTGESSRAFQKLNKSIIANEARLSAGGGFFGKLDARFSAVATALGTLGPTIAATIANAIGRETKGQRVAGATFEAAGQTLSFAALGNLFGSKGRNIAALSGLALGAKNIFDQATTDLPELQAAADKAAQSLTQFNDASQRIIQSFEKITDLRQSGQAEKAGRLESQLLKDIALFQDPEIRQQARAAVANRDQKALVSSLDRGAEEQEKTNQTQASLLEIPTIVKSIKSIDSQIRNTDLLAGLPGFPGFVDSEEKKQKLEEKRIQEIDKLFANLNIFSGEAFAPGSAALESFTGVQEKLASGAGFEDIFTDLGVDSEVIKSLVKQEAELREGLIETIKRRIAEEELIVKNSIEGSKVTDAINSAFEELRKNLNNYSKTVSEALSVQVSGRTGIESSLGVLRTQSLRSRAEIQTEFGAVREGRATGLQADLSEINETFNSSVREAVGASFQSLIPILGSVIPQIENLATILQPGTEGTQERAEAAILAVQDKISELGSQFDLSRLEDLLGTSLSGAGSVGLVDDPQALVSQIKEAFKDAGVPAEKFDALEKALNDQNRTLIESKRIQEEQKLILAQQRFTENVKFLVGAIKSSFGGFEGFLKNNFIDNIEQIEDSTASLRILEGGDGNVSSIESARDLGTLVQELSRIAGRSIAPQLEGGDQSEVIQQIIRGQGLEISETIKTILGNVQGFEGSENIANAFIESLQKTLGTDESDIDVLSNEIARIQTTAANELGKVNEQILDQALKDLGVEDPQLAEDLKKAFELGFGLDETEELLKLQFKTANSYLKRIADGIDKGITEATEEKGTPLIPGSAGGSLPRGMRIANDKEVISKNFAKEVRQQSRYGYSGGNPVLLSGFDERKDAIFNPTMIKKMGMPPNAKNIAAGGYIPSIVRTLGGTGSNKKDLINRLINSGLSPKEAFQYATKLTQGSALSRAKYGASLSNFINFGKPLLALPGVVSRQAINSLIPGAALGKATGFALNANKIPNSLTSLLDRLGSSPSKFKKTIAFAGKFLGTRAAILSAGITASQGGLAAYRGGEERDLYLKRKQEEFSTSGFSDVGSALSNFFRGLADPTGLGASLIANLSEAIELSEGDLSQVFLDSLPLDLLGLGNKRRQAKIDEENKRYQEQLKRLQGQASRGVIFGQRSPEQSIPVGLPDVTKSQKEIQKENLSILSDLPEAPPFQFSLNKAKDLKIDDISDINPRKLEEQRKRKQKLIDDNINLNLLRWSAGTQAEFKQYDDSGEFTGVTELFGKVGRPEAGSRAELNSQLIELNDRIKANRNPRESLALARQARKIQEKIAGDTTKSEFKGKLFEGRAAQELLKTDGFRGGEVSNINQITRAITDKNGKIVGYARNSNSNVTKELLPDPGLSLSLQREKLETGLGDEDIYIKNLPELRKIDNPEGLGVFNYQQEGTSRSERRAIEEEERLSRIVQKPNIGKIPNFAQDSSAANINVGPINVNLTSNLSKDSAQEYGEEFSTKLEEQIAPLLEKIKQELDQKYGRASETVTNLLRSNNFTEFAPPPTSR
jgi:TP901 family phage tail tape measure protein